MEKVAGGVVVNTNNEVVVVSQHHTSWSLPKGHVEEGETIFDGAVREVVEESGIPNEELMYVRSLGSYIRNKISKDGTTETPQTPREIHWFLFRTGYTDELVPLDEENPEARWIPIDEVAQLLTHQKDREFFEAIKGEIE